MKNVKEKDGRIKLTQEMVDTICDPKMVMEWGGLTQAERAVRLHRIHPQVKITGQYLGQIYKRYGI